MVLVRVYDEHGGKGVNVACSKDGMITAWDLATTFGMVIHDFGLLINERKSKIECLTQVVLPDNRGCVQLPWKIWLRQGDVRVQVFGRKESKIVDGSGLAKDSATDSIMSGEEIRGTSRIVRGRAKLNSDARGEVGVGSDGSSYPPQWFNNMASPHVGKDLVLAAKVKEYLLNGIFPPEYNGGWKDRQKWQARMKNWKLRKTSTEAEGEIYKCCSQQMFG